MPVKPGDGKIEWQARTNSIFTQDTPLSTTQKVFAFPSDLGTPRFPHYVMFHINNNTKATAAVGTSVTPEGNEPKNLVAGQSGGGIQSFINNFKRTDTSIALYMPPQIKTTYNQIYEKSDMNFLGNIIAGALSNLKGVNTEEGVLKAIKSAGVSVAKTVAGAGEGTLRKSVGMLSNAVMSGSDAAIMGALTGKVDNPRTEAMFASTDLRTHQFSFTFIPQNEKESDLIADIIDIFKISMHPELAVATQGNNGSVSLEGSYLITPSTFDIEFYNISARNEMIHKISTSVLESMDVDYSGSGSWLAFKGTGNPYQVNLSLQFKEIRPMHRTDVIQGY
jgi:hypothetical protein